MEQRIAHRFVADMEADCRSCSRAWTSRLCNISTTGCMIVCPEPSLPESALLRLRLRGLTAIDGQIVWQNRGHAGIRFSVPLHQAMIEHLGFREPEADVASITLVEPVNGSGKLPSLSSRLVKRSWLEEPEVRIAANG